MPIRCLQRGSASDSSKTLRKHQAYLRNEDIRVSLVVAFREDLDYEVILDIIAHASLDSEIEVLRLILTDSIVSR